MLIDLSPLKASRDYRLLFFGQLVSFFGSMMTFIPDYALGFLFISKCGENQLVLPCWHAVNHLLGAAQRPSQRPPR